MIYLDNSATTKPCDTAIQYVNNAIHSSWGNPSSLYHFGIDAENILTETRELCAKSIGAAAEEIFFTSGGTEANNTVLRGVAKSRKKRGNRIVISAIEHACIKDTAADLANDGFEIIELPVDKCGRVAPEDIYNAVNDKTILVSLMLVNNEVGTIQPVAEARNAIEQAGAPALLHTDAVQAFGKIPINVSKLGVDLLTASAHKIHGIKGCGFLYKARGVFLPPYLTGGGQEHGFRSGTEAVPAVAGLLGALKELDVRNNYKHAQTLNEYAHKKLSALGFVDFNSPTDAIPHILNFSVPGLRSETMLHFLENDGICVSSGSACSKGKGSYVLAAMGLDARRVDSALRISFCKDNTESDIDALCASLTKAFERLKKSQ